MQKTVPVYDCPVCGYPIRGPSYQGEEVHCPSCSSSFVAQSVTIPSWLLATFLAFGAGVFFGPVILASTEAGSQWLAKLARERIK
jgi:hypothetical protein